MNTINLLKAVNHWREDTTMTTTQTTHTTGTWTIRPATKPHGIERSHDVAIMDSDGEIIAECFEKVGRTSEGRFIERPAYANAAHIVHCVNTYPALLDALKLAAIMHPYNVTFSQAIAQAESEG